jgi:hypothetical protein
MAIFFETNVMINFSALTVIICVKMAFISPIFWRKDFKMHGGQNICNNICDDRQYDEPQNDGRQYDEPQYDGRK